MSQRGTRIAGASESRLEPGRVLRRGERGGAGRGVADEQGAQDSGFEEEDDLERLETELMDPEWERMRETEEDGGAKALGGEGNRRREQREMAELRAG